MFISFDEPKTAKKVPSKFRQAKGFQNRQQVSSKNFYQGVSLPLIKASLQSGKFDLSSKNLVEIPEFLSTINEEIPLEIKSLDPEYPWYSTEIITQLIFSYNQIPKIRPSLANISCLKRLDLCDNQISELPDFFESFQELSVLNLSFNNLTSIPASIMTNASIQILSLQENKLCGSMRFQTSSLRELNLSANNLVSLKINCDNLTKLNASKNQLATCKLESAKQIYDLDLSGNALPDFALPAEVNNLRFLTLNCNKLSSFPRGLENCKNLSKLELRENHIASLPSNILEILPKSLTSLELGTNNISEIDQDVAQLTNLTRLDFSSNNLSDIPAELALIDALQVLNISQNPMRKMRSCLNKNTTELLKFLRSRLPVEKLDAVSPIVSPRNEPISGQITVNGKGWVDVSQIFDSYIGYDFASLRSLDLSKNKLTKLCSLKVCSNLTDLNLSMNCLSDASFDGVVFGCAKLVSLNLNQNRIVMGNSADFFKAIEGCKIETILM